MAGLSAEFYQKDTRAIHNFFDIDKNNKCSEQEFMSQMAKAERLLKVEKEKMSGGRPPTAGSLRGGHNEEYEEQSGTINDYIPGYNRLSPRS